MNRLRQRRCTADIGQFFGHARQRPGGQYWEHCCRGKTSTRGGQKFIAVLMTLSMLSGCGAMNPSVSPAEKNAVSGSVAERPGVAGQADGNASVALVGQDGAASPLVSMAEDIGSGPVVSYEAEDTDASWNETHDTTIVFSDSRAKVEGTGAEAIGAVVTIAVPGTYVFSGYAAQGQIRVHSEIKGVVRLVLNGLRLSNPSTAPIEITKSAKTILILADGTENIIQDGAGERDPSEASESVEDPNAAIWSKGDITIVGTGSLRVQAGRNHGIFSKDGLRIVSGTISVTAVADGIKARDFVAVAGGTVKVIAGSDAIQASNDEDAQKGFVLVEAGVVVLSAQGDGIQAESDVLLLGGTLDIATGAGSGSASGSESASGSPPMAFGRDLRRAAQSTDTESRKGVKAAGEILVGDGLLTIDAQDDALHANQRVTIRGGTLQLSSGDDGIHADAAVVISSGTIDIPECYEGIESLSITVQGGAVSLTARDDGFNVAGGADGTSGNGRPGQDMFASLEGALLSIQGGTIRLNTEGDGLDSNGDIEMTGGDVVVFGPTNNANGAIDYNGTFAISGGVLLATGSSGMAESPDSSSTQPVLMVNFDSIQAAGSLLSLTGVDEKPLDATIPPKAYQSVVYSSSKLRLGDVVKVQIGGSSSGVMVDGHLPSTSVVTGATLVQTVALKDLVTVVGKTVPNGNRRVARGQRLWERSAGRRRDAFA